MHRILIYIVITFTLIGCQLQHDNVSNTSINEVMECSTATPSRLATFKNDITIKASKYISKKGMILIDGGTFMMGADDKSASPDEYPKHKVTVEAFWIDATEVTNAQFAEFVKETNYITTAEQIPDWEEMKSNFRPAHQSLTTVCLLPHLLYLIRRIQKLTLLIIANGGYGKKVQTGNILMARIAQ